MRRTRLVGALLLAGAVTGLAAGPAHAQEYRYWSFWHGEAAKVGQGKGSQGKGGSDSWSYATEGPATIRPADGSVEGFRFTVSADSAAAGKPRTAADFDAICRDTPAQHGRKRIGIVIDFGTAGDAAEGERPPRARTECAQVSDDASAGDALAAVAQPLRYDSNALLCAIAGYPKSGCADQVNGSDSSGDSNRSGGSGSPDDSDGAGSSASSSSDAAADGNGTGKRSPGGDEASGGNGGSGGDGGPSAGLLGGAAAVVVLGAAAVWQARRRRG